MLRVERSHAGSDHRVSPLSGVAVTFRTPQAVGRFQRGDHAGSRTVPGTSAAAVAAPRRAAPPGIPTPHPTICPPVEPRSFAPDEELVARLRDSRSEAAFRDIHRRHTPRLLALIIRMLGGAGARAFSAAQPGRPVRFTERRGGETLTLEIVPESSAPRRQAPPPDRPE